MKNVRFFDYSARITYMILLSFPRVSALRAKHFLTTALPRIFCNLLWTFVDILQQAKEFALIEKRDHLKTCFVQDVSMRLFGIYFGK